MALAAKDSIVLYEASVKATNYFAVNVDAFESRGYESGYKLEAWLRHSYEVNIMNAVSGEVGNIC